MKQITYITTTAACDDTFDKIEHLNTGFFADHYKKDIIVLRGNFSPDVFEWVDDTHYASYKRYANQQEHKEITEERYNDMLNVMPPIYLSHIDGNKVDIGFGVGEAYTNLDNGTCVLTTCYKRNGKYYECFCAVFKNTDKPITDTYSAEWSSDNYGITYTK